MSDFHNIETSGSHCVGCGKSSDHVKLLRINTYATALACFECWGKHRLCADCNHEPHGVCPDCGCTPYRHGLEGEFDRQYANCVGKIPLSRQCTGFANRSCENIVLADADGNIARLCSKCYKEWVQGVKETMKSASAILDFNVADPEGAEGATKH